MFVRLTEVNKTTIRIMCIGCCPCRYLPLIKGYSQHFEIWSVYKLELRREIKLSSSNEYLCFETDNSRT